jgi:hypothetical protein
MWVENIQDQISRRSKDRIRGVKVASAIAAAAIGAAEQMFGALSKSSVQNNKSRDVGKATNKRRSLPAAQQFGLRDYCEY